MSMSQNANAPTKDDSDRMIQMITAYWTSQIVRSMAVFGIADRLAAGPRTADDLASEVGAHPDTLARLLRASVSLGLIKRDGESFARTSLLATLQDGPSSLRWSALALAGPGHWRRWGHLPEAIREGHHQDGDDGSYWDHLSRHPAEEAAFSAAMSSLTTLVSNEVVRLMDVGSSSSIADIGGANGLLLEALLRAHPDTDGILFDRPAVVGGAASMIDAGLSNRIELVGGDFFLEVPAADFYLLKHILHDWNDEHCVRILKVIKTAMPANGRLAVIELVPAEDGSSEFASLMDLNMLAVVSGRERTASEYERLFAAAGLRTITVTPTRSPYAIIIATHA